MDGFSKASAVHRRVEDDKQESEKGEECLKRNGSNPCDPSPYTSHKCSSDYGLNKSEQHSETFSCSSKESKVEEIKVFVHDESRSHRVHELEDAGDEEYDSADDSTEASGLEDEIMEEIRCRHTRQRFSVSSRKSRQVAAYCRFRLNSRFL